MADISMFQKKKKEKEEGQGFDKDAWMVTFSDLLQLLITFFVLLISMSSMDKQVFKEMFAVFSGGVGVLSFTDATKIVPPVITPRVVPPMLDVEDFKALIRSEILHLDERAAQAKEIDSLVDSILISGVDVERRGRNFAMVLDEEGLFEKNSTTISPALYPALDLISEVLSFSKSKVIVEGHTDNIQYGTPVLPSNWELSAARAVSVYIYMVNKGGIDPTRMDAKGYAGYHPKVKNISEKYRKRNRRIEIVIKQYKEDAF